MKRMSISLFLLIISMLIGLPAMSKEIEHIIERGETIESVAQKYKVTADDIKKANPEMGGSFYAGTVIIIPEVAQTAESIIVTDNEVKTGMEKSAQAYGSFTESTSSTPALSSSSEGDTASLFGSTYLFYMANPEHFDLGVYGIGFDNYKSNGIGYTAAIGLSYGIVKPGSISFLFGGTYGVPVNEFILPALKLRGFIGFGEMNVGYKTIQSVRDTKNYDINEIVCNGGIYFTPEIKFRINTIIIGIGYDLGFNSYRGIDNKQTVTQSKYTTEVKYDRKQQTSFAHGLELSVGIHF